MKKILCVLVSVTLLFCVLSLSALAAGEEPLALKGPSGSVAVGEEFQVVLCVTASDIAAFQYSVAYDEAFRILSTELVDATDSTLVNHVAKGVWLNMPLSESVDIGNFGILSNTDLSGEFIVFTFTSVSAVDGGVISVEAFGSDNEENRKDFPVSSVEVTTIDPSAKLLGDVNGDGAISQTDSVLLLRSISGWTVSIDAVAADINRDGKLTQTDYAFLVRYLAGWDVSYAIGQPIP